MSVFLSLECTLNPNSSFSFLFPSGFMKIRMAAHILVLALLAVTCSLTHAYDPSPLQDFCVAVLEPQPPVFVNGFLCKDPKMVQADDFFFSGLDRPGNTSNKVRSNVTLVTVNQLPGLNTLGISLVRIDIEPYGVNSPHEHPRASEILTVIEGTLYAGFVTSNPDNRLITKILNKGDVFVFPKGLIHFQFNIGKTHAVAIASLSSQFPGVMTISNAVFGSNPRIPDDVLAKAFHVDSKVIDLLKAQF
ncbi:putative germin-like protein 2-1 [Magnolia sinica]|uniref:putative germin-like protein 2-1 n=1 Tax=Magnolia sinica TaxID=86752 RepID=UPI00265A7104|nr:putative germin-like protein 2-1 [Magnolia sinica]